LTAFLKIIKAGLEANFHNMTIFKIRLIAAFAVIFTAMGYGTAMAADISVSITLEQCEQDAVNNSAKLRQLNSQILALEESVNAAHSAYFPSITLDAQGGWVSEVPEMKIGAMSMKYGDNWSYSAGPAAKYILYDGKGRSSRENAQKAALKAKKQEAEYAEKQIRMQARQAYFALQQNLQKTYLINSQIELARKQLKDLNSAYQAGTKTPLDVLIAKKQVNAALAKMTEARSGLASALRVLFRIAGTDYGINPEYPLDKRLAKASLPGNSSSLIDADSIEKTLSSMEHIYGKEFDENSPRLAALESMKEYYEKLSEAAKSALSPSAYLSGGAYLQYPNGPVKESVFLGKAGASISVPLFEGGKSSSQTKAHKHSAEAASFEKKDAESSLKNIFLTAKDRIYALSVEEDILKNMEQDSAETAKLAYEAYKAGTVTFFEVDNANVQLLECRMSLSDMRIKKLNALAIIDSLGR